jgi:CRISPR/Cas system-associated exonuclease Cas4 (RecB family)
MADSSAPVQPNLEAYSISKIIDSFLQWRNAKDNSRSYSVYHPSAFGKCLRKMQYQKYSSDGIIDKPTKYFDARTLRIFDTGHSIHHRWAEYMRNMKVIRGLWRCDSCGFCHGKDHKLGVFEPESCQSCGHHRLSYDEITVEDKDINFYGHCDQILDFSRLRPDFLESEHGKTVLSDLENLPNGPFVVDMKSIGKSQWSKIYSSPHFEYVVQLTTYIHILDLQCGLLIYEKKDDSELKFFRIGRNDELWSAICQQAKLMLQMAERKSLPPPRPRSKDSWECKTCEYKDICHASSIWSRDDLDELRSKFYTFDREA